MTDDRDMGSPQDLAEHKLRTRPSVYCGHARRSGRLADGKDNDMEHNKNAVALSPSEAIATLVEYKRARAELDARLDGERSLWRAIYSGGGSSSWIFNSIVNKHADIVDAIPTCVCLPREPGDERDADVLSRIIPVICERTGFEQIYSDNSWEKLKHGTAVYGVFWNNSLEGGLGDVDIRAIDIDRVYWDAGVCDIQDSKNLFIVGFADVDELEGRYPQFNYEREREEEQSLLNSLYGSGGGDGKCLVVDLYYKKLCEDGEIRLHLCKLAGECVLYSSEADENMSEGWYQHGKYPVVIDRMYPIDGDVCGFGLISIGRSPQEYINRLDSNMLGYTDWASRVRFWAKRSLGVNEKDFLDLDKSIVEVEGDIDEEKLKQIEIGQIDDSVIDVKRLKIEELKEITGSRDVSQGGISGGVTAASAISILRESGAKSSRDGIAQSYRAYVSLISLIIELIKQFYDEPRIFRIIGDDGGREYLRFSGRSLREGGRRPHFDIEVSAMKKSPSESEQKNGFAKELYEKGAFKKENAEETLLMLELMDFEGVGRLRTMIKSRYGGDEKNDCGGV